VEVGPSRCTSSFGTATSGETSSGKVAWSGSAQSDLLSLFSSISPYAQPWKGLCHSVSLGAQWG
jgi:hypothetical protein